MKADLKKRLVLVAKLIALTVVLMLVSGVASNLLPASAVGGDSAEEIGMMLVLAILFAQVMALAIPIVRSRWTGWRLATAMAVVYFGTVTFMNQVESLVYLDDKMPEGFLSGLFLMGFVIAAVFSPIAVVTLGKWKAMPSSTEVPAPALRLGKWGWRVAAAGLVYLCLYYLFGYYIPWQDPEIRTYYGGTDPGSFLAQIKTVAQGMPWMIPFQYVRGVLWVLLALLVIRSMRGPWWHAGLATAILFALPALYLLFPNPIMPEFVRMTHLFETLPYQFLFGWFVAWFCGDRQGRDQVESRYIQPGNTSENYR
jgi:hypothetical protein